MCKGITLVFLTNDKVQKSKRLDINHTFYRINCLLETTVIFFQIEIILKSEVFSSEISIAYLILQKFIFYSEGKNL